MARFSSQPRSYLPRLKTLVPRDDTAVAVFVGLVGAFGFAFLLWAVVTFDTAIRGASDWLGTDFFVYWAAAKYVLAGHLDRLYDIAAFTEFQLGIVDKSDEYFSPWPYPPHGLFAVLGFGLLPYAWALALWSGLTFLFYNLTATGGRLVDIRTLILLTAPATVVTIIAGQNGLLTGALLAGGFFLLDRRPILAGILFGLLTFKPQMGLLIPVALIAAGLWRPFMAAAASGLAVMALSAAVFGIETWQNYVRFIPDFQAGIAAGGAALADIQPTVIRAARVLGLSETPAYLIQGATALLVCAGIFFVFRRGTDRRMQSAAAFLGTPLASPYFFIYDMPIISIAVMLMTARALQTGFLTGERLLLLLAWLSPFLVIKLNPIGLPLAPFILAGLFLMAAKRSVAEGRETPRGDHPQRLLLRQSPPAFDGPGTE